MLDHPIDWQLLATKLGTLHEHGESGGSEIGRRGLIEIVGPSAWRDAVDYYLTFQPGCEVARSVLSALEPEAAVDRCVEIYESSADIHTRRSAVELLRAVAGAQHVPLVERFLADADPDIQGWGIGILDQLVFRSNELDSKVKSSST